MTKYTAEFSNGDIVTRNSDRSYSHAYRVTAPNGDVWQQGFSARRDLAETAARASGPKRYSKRNLRYAHQAAYYKKLAKTNGFGDVQAMFAAKDLEVDQWWAAAKVEIVEVQS